jgi:hypothetical protein
VTGRDELLRAAVYRAHALRETDRFAAACADVVDCHLLYPWIEAELALERVRAQQAHLELELEAATFGWYLSIGIAHEQPAAAQAAA